MEDEGKDASVSSRETLLNLISRLDVFLPSENEMQCLKFIGIDGHLAKVTVVKQGERGASLYRASSNASWVAGNAHQPLAHASAILADVVDTIGAGDAFNAGFLVAWLNNSSPDACLRQANQCGSIAVTLRGGASGIPGIT